MQKNGPANQGMVGGKSDDVKFTNHKLWARAVSAPRRPNLQNENLICSTNLPSDVVFNSPVDGKDIAHLLDLVSMSSSGSDPPESPEGGEDVPRENTQEIPQLPPGDLFLTPGTKTPRKVQWLRTEGHHELDERALDPSAFQRLTQALERHKAGAPVRVHHYPPQGPAHVHTMIPEGKRETVSRFDVADPTTPIYNRRLGPDASPPQLPGYYIEPTENVGLPGNDPGTQARKEAERLVRSITKRRPFPSMSRSRLEARRSKGKSKLSRSRGSSPGSGASTDVERDAESEPPESSGRGVLSTLLSLYSDPDGFTSDSGPPTPLYSPWETTHHDSARPSHRRQFSTDSIEEVDEAEAPPPSLVPEHTTDRSASAPPSNIKPPLGAKKRIKSYLSPSNVVHRHRMPMTRNGAGVFGPLIAATGTLTAVAAPAQSQLQPDLKRPGYRLSRYSLDEKKMNQSPRSRSVGDSLRSAPPSEPPSPPSPTLSEPAPRRVRWTGMLKDMPSLTSLRSGMSTPTYGSPSTPIGDSYFELQFPGKKDGRNRDDENKWEKKKKRKKAQVFITRHVAKIIERQEFIMKLCRAMMMFGGPSHRLQSQIMSTAKVLDIDCSCIYLPDVLILSFDDPSTSTSSVKFIRQGSSLDLQKLDDAYVLYRKVIYDKLSVSDASVELDELMRRPQFYSTWQLIIIGGFCSSSICTVSFGGSFLDALIVFPLGALLVAIQILSTRNELYSNVFEVTVTTLFSFIAAALAATRKFCYSAVASSSIVLILPGFLVLCGSLEIMSRNIVAGSVRLCYAVVYALFLGFGLAIGAEVFQEITGTRVVGSEDYVCVISHPVDGPWYRQTPSQWWAFLTVPMFSVFLSMKNQAPYNRKELLLLVVIACAGWTTNHFVGLKFNGQSDIIAAVGAFAVGLIANLYARFFRGNAFVIMITGILFQVPSGLGVGGLLTYASQQTGGSSSSYLYGFQTALKLISVAIGLTVGLGISLVLMHPIQSKRRAGGIFSL